MIGEEVQMTRFDLRTKRATAARVALLTFILAAPMSAHGAATNAPTKVFQAVMDCRALSEASARLACYDAATAGLGEAEKKGDIVVIDREQATTARRQAFGFDLGALSILDKVIPAEDLNAVTTTLSKAYQDANGKWVLVLEDGGVWRQTDTTNLSRPAHAGSTVKIRRAALGSFFINVDGQLAMRAQRSQ
jgi:hypothetical protein